MVVVSMAPSSNRRCRLLPGIPVVDLSLDRSLITQFIVKTCEEFGFFKIINHGVPHSVSASLEEAGVEFFNLPDVEKQRAGPPNPLGYGCRTIGLNGDIGDVEYLLLPADSTSVSQIARIICKKDPNKFSCAVKKYVEAMKELANEILELIEEGLGLGGSGVLCKLIRESGSDSLLRLNHYPSNLRSWRCLDPTALEVSKYSHQPQKLWVVEWYGLQSHQTPLQCSSTLEMLSRLVNFLLLQFPATPHQCRFFILDDFNSSSQNKISLIYFVSLVIEGCDERKAGECETQSNDQLPQVKDVHDLFCSTRSSHMANSSSRDDHSRKSSTLQIIHLGRSKCSGISFAVAESAARSMDSSARSQRGSSQKPHLRRPASQGEEPPKPEGSGGVPP